jgi:hypothetical protein
MILAQLFAATLTVGVAMGPSINAPVERLSLHQRNVATQAYVLPATECIAANVMSDVRFKKDEPTANLGDLIVAAVPKCGDAVRALIAAYDRYFGVGVGEEYFMGPYLDVLPDLLLKKARTASEQN